METVSAHDGRYQNESVALAVPDGMLMSWVTMLSPAGSVPEAVPRNAEYEPACVVPVEITGFGAAPFDIQGLKEPVSKPGLATSC